MKWLWKLLVTMLIFLVGLLLAVWLSLQWSLSASWVLAKGFSALLSVPVHVEGDVKIELWPELRAQVQTVQLCSEDAPPCANWMADLEIRQIHASDVQVVADWRPLLEGRPVLVNWLGMGALNVVVDDSSRTASVGRAASQSRSNARQLASWFEESFSIRETDLERVQIRSVMTQSETAQGFFAQRVRMKAQDPGTLDATVLSVVLDEVQLNTSFFEHWGLADLQSLSAQTVRVQLTIEKDIVQIQQMDLIGAPIRVQDISGWIDWADETLSLHFKMDAQTLKQQTAGSGFEIQLRDRLLPVHVSGSWHHPLVQAGQTSP